MLLVQQTIYIVKLLVLHQIYWFRTAGQASISNTVYKELPLVDHSVKQNNMKLNDLKRIRYSFVPQSMKVKEVLFLPVCVCL